MSRARALARVPKAEQGAVVARALHRREGGNGVLVAVGPYVFATAKVERPLHRRPVEADLHPRLHPLRRFRKIQNRRGAVSRRELLLFHLQVGGAGQPEQAEIPPLAAVGYRCQRPLLSASWCDSAVRGGSRQSNGRSRSPCRAALIGAGVLVARPGDRIDGELVCPQRDLSGPAGGDEALALCGGVCQLIAIPIAVAPHHLGEAGAPRRDCREVGSRKDRFVDLEVRRTLKAAARPRCGADGDARWSCCFLISRLVEANLGAL